MLTIWNLLPMAAVFILCLLAADRRPKSATRTVTGVPGNAKGERWFWPLTGGLLLLALGLRLWQLWLCRETVLPEEMWAVLQGRSLWRTGRSIEGLVWPAVLPGSAGEGSGPLITWLAILPAALLGNHPLAVRLPALGIQMLAMLALWDMTRRAYSRRAALWVLLLCALSPTMLMQARWPQAWQLLPHMVLLALWAFARTKGRGGPVILGFLLLALSMYTCDTAWYVVPVFALLSMTYLGIRKAAHPFALLAGFGLFIVLSLPALYALGAQSLGLAPGRVLGMEVARLADYPHAGDFVAQFPQEPFTTYNEMPPQQGMGLQFLPFLRGNRHVAALAGDLFSAFYQWLSLSMLQYVPDPGYTLAYFLPAFGGLYLMSIPLTLLGMLLFVVRWLRRRKSPFPLLQQRITGLVLLLLLSAAPFYLLHMDLTPPHFGLMFYPLVLCTAYGIRYVARKVRFSGLIVLLLYLLNLGFFLATPVEQAPAFPGFVQALEFAKEQETEQVVVTTRLYPSEDPASVAALGTQWVFDLEGTYVRGEHQQAGQLPYAERFHYVYFPGYTMDPAQDAVYVLHESETGQLDWDLLDDALYEEFGEFVVIRLTE